MRAELNPTFIIYGNCQAAALAYIFESDPTIRARYRIRYIASFGEASSGTGGLTRDEAVAAEVVFEQVDPKTMPHRDDLPANCKTLRFPSMDLTLLWPLFSKISYDEAPTPMRPWGRFPQGDRVVTECVERGLSLEEAVAHYHRASGEQIRDLERHRDLERARLAARDAKADVPIGDYVFDQLQKQNMFWTVNHPTMALLRELCRRLIDVASSRVPALRDVAIDNTIDTLPADGPLDGFRVPIHPVVVEHFDLEWYRAQEGRNYGLRYESRLTYEEYVREMIETSLRVKRSLSSAPIRQA